MSEDTDPTYNKALAARFHLEEKFARDFGGAAAPDVRCNRLNVKDWGLTVYLDDAPTPEQRNKIPDIYEGVPVTIVNRLKQGI